FCTDRPKILHAENPSYAPQGALQRRRILQVAADDFHPLLCQRFGSAGAGVASQSAQFISSSERVANDGATLAPGGSCDKHDAALRRARRAMVSRVGFHSSAIP